MNTIILYKDNDYIITYDAENRDIFSKKIPIKLLTCNDVKSFIVAGDCTDIYKDPSKLYHDLFMEIWDDTKDNNKVK